MHSLDWIYIHGHPDPSYTNRTLELYFPKVKAGGLVAGDGWDCVGALHPGCPARRPAEEYERKGLGTLLTVAESGQFMIKKIV